MTEPRAAHRWYRDDALIDGAWVKVGAAIPVENPATEQEIGSAASSGPEHVDAAVTAARAAFESWSRMPDSERADHLQALHISLAARRDELVAATVAEVGAPVRVAREAHVDISLDILASYVDLLRVEQLDERIGNSLVLREPAGVVGCITPWNYPLYQLVIKVAAALAAGCTVVAKPAELTPLTAYLLADASLAAALPAGVVNLVPGSGTRVGEAIVTHPDVDVVSFTGSTGVGSRIAAQAAASLKRVCLELGGKSASVVLPDADLETAVRATVDSATVNTGQTCSAWTRLLVPAQRYDEAVSLATKRAGELVVGDPQHEDTDLGPLISARQRQTVLDLVARARSAGAVVTELVDHSGDTGHYVSPVVVSEVAPGDQIVQQEVFGPVLVVLPYDTEDDAVRIANDTDYGLAGAVWAGDEAHALAVARRLRTGQVDVNGAEFNIDAPFGGYKKSGYGRELGRFGLEEFQQIKSVQL
ncbi:aldehyde dehydrogenase family protein [Geodermatophilus sp. DF01-2]|uniref:aldehyde dehydrogenase family protein n=1 Tax=Geodermatophilus sp. DF01-2 TaxID=2559610 RepID=UPI0010733CEC|nr:aldehyde dehydrogenase family protein [Geodermatophilus sp. DF01_2]TFV63975.1 aldehyde dehydrogenase family protein [Geodermatophilus sp. DF01_2]